MPHIYNGISGEKLIEEINNYSIDSRGVVTGHDEEGNPVIAEDNTQEINSNLTVNGKLILEDGIEANGSFNISGETKINNNLSIYGTLHTQGDMKVSRDTPIGNDIRDVITYEYLRFNFIKYYSKIIKEGKQDWISLGYPFGKKVDDYHFLIGAYVTSSSDRMVLGYRYGSYGSFGENFTIYNDYYEERSCYVQILNTGEVKVRPSATEDAHLQILAFPVYNVS